MGKLYYITGSNEQIRMQVYEAILQWSQTQQSQPLQAWSVQQSGCQAEPAQQQKPEMGQLIQQQPETAQPTQLQQPNLYLYNYLAQGSGETIAQLTECYGEESVEIIYLRKPEETEAECLQAGIYKSYDPQTNLPKCLQEIVETVFTGYKSVNYDFAAALWQQQQRRQQRQQQEQPQQTTEQSVLPKARQRNSKTTSKGVKLFRRILLLALWIMIVCLATIWIYKVVTGWEIEKETGHLIQILPTEA